eukprot:gene2706-2956_t
MTEDHAMETIQYEPHYKSVTEQGRHHFNRHADALAELIDNSIQFSKDVNNSMISISTHQNSPSNFVVVADNGCGMDVDDIKAFATFALDRKTRNISPTDESDHHYISKFGVGAKQAGFYLGHSISIISKSASSPHVLYFTMDESTFEDRYRLQQNIYSDNVYRLASTRSLQEQPPCPLDYSQSVWEAIHEFASSSSFTVIVIKLREEISIQMEEDGMQLGNDLADIYYFHLHPEAMPMPNHRSQNDVAISPFISYRMFSRGKSMKEVILNDNETCRSHLFIKERRDTFKFELQVLDPSPPSQAERGISTQLSQLDPVKRCPVYGMISYYPYFHDHETHPDHDNTSDGGESSVNQPKYFVYWQRRLVPQSTWSTLPFFDKLNDPKTNLSNLGVALNWPKRIQGFLFFDWTFNHISNNKLRLLVSPDFNTWVNSKEVKDKMLVKPKDCANRFMDFLVKCGQFDREFYFSGRIKADDRRATPPYESLCSYFREMNYSRQGKIKLVAGDKVRWKAKSAIEYYAQIIDFEIPRPLSLDQATYCGTGYFRYSLLPSHILGEVVNKASVSALFAADNAGQCKVTEEDEKSYLDKLPADIIVARDAIVFDPQNQAARNMEEYLVGSCAKYNLYFMLRDAQDNPVFSLPFHPNGKSHRYEVELQIEDQEGRTADLGRDKKLFDPDKKDEVATITNSNMSKLGYKFVDINIANPGNHKFIVKVLSKLEGKDVVVYDGQVDVRVISINPTALTIQCPEAKKPIYLDNPLPTLTMSLSNDSEGGVLYSGEVLVSATAQSDCITVVRREGWDGKYLLSGDQRGEFEVRKGSWFVEMTNMMVGDDDIAIGVKGSKVRVLFEVVLASSLTIRKEVEFSILPGHPRNLVVVGEETPPIPIKMGSQLPKLTIVVRDRWGNSVAPQRSDENSRWRIQLKSGKMLAASEASMRPGHEETHLSLEWLSSLPTVDESGEEESYELRLATGDEAMDSLVEPLYLQFHFLPSQLPCKIQLRHDGEVLPDEIELVAGAVLSNLSFELLDATNKVIADISDHINRTSSLECSWLVKKRGKRKKEQIPSDGVLPKLTVPEVAHQTVHFDLELSLSKDIELFHSLHVRVLPGDPCGLKIISSCSLEDGIRTLDEEDLAKKIRGLGCVDKHDNLLSDFPYNLLSNAELTISTESEGGKEDQESMQVLELVPGPLTVETELGQPALEIAGLSLPLQASLSQLFEPNTRIRIAASTPDCPLHEASPLQTIVRGGIPASVRLSSKSLKIAQATSVADVNVAVFSKLDDIALHLVDTSGGQASLNGVQDMQLTISTDDGHQVPYQPERIHSHYTTLSLDYDMKALFDARRKSASATPNTQEDLNTFKLHFEVSFNTKGTTHRLPEAVLCCHPVRCDHINNLEIKFIQECSQQEGTKVTKDEQNYIVHLIAGTRWPDIRIQAMTDNGAPFKHVMTDFHFRFKSESNKKKKMQFSDLFDAEVLDAAQTIRVSSNGTPQVENLTSKVGEYEIKVSYTESRVEYANLPKDLREHSAKVKVKISPARPSKLNFGSNGHPVNSVVTNTEISGHRLILRKPRIEVMDAHGNVCSLEEDSLVLTCQVIAVSANSNDVPLLENAEGGLLTAKWDGEGFSFQDISVKQSSSCPAGTYGLCFLLKTSRGELRHEIPFQYADREHYDEEQARLKTELQRLRAEERHFEGLAAQINELKKQRNAQLANVSETVVQSLDDLETLRSLRQNRLSQLGHLQGRCSAPRPAVKSQGPDPVLVSNSGGLGMLVDLAYVNDPSEARILSYHAQKYMDAWIVSTHEIAEELFSRGVKAWAIGHIKPFAMTFRNSNNLGSLRERSSEEKAQGLLPLPSVQINGEPAPGNPQYLVNVLRLDTEREGLRDTIFNAIFGISILFDTLHAASQYRKYCIEKKVACGTLYSRRGDKIDAHGLMDPRDRVPQHMNYVFGEQPVHKTKEYTDELHQTEREKTALEHLITYGEEIKDLSVQQRKTDIEGVRKQIGQLKMELKRISYALHGEIPEDSSGDEMEEDS